MSTPHLLAPPAHGQICIALIGMAACGKSVVGAALAERLGWAHVDTDYLIEATYGARLQQVTDALGKEAFLDVECEIIRTVRMQRAVISTGGSAVYRAAAMQHLASLGPVVHLDVPLPLILSRIAENPQRGLAIAPGQSLEELFAEREALYHQWANAHIPAGQLDVQGCVEAVTTALELPQTQRRSL